LFNYSTLTDHLAGLMTSEQAHG